MADREVRFKFPSSAGVKNRKFDRNQYFLVTLLFRKRRSHIFPDRRSFLHVKSSGNFKNIQDFHLCVLQHY